MNKYLFLSVVCCACTSTPVVTTQLLQKEALLTLPGPAGKFDFMGTDAAMSRILAAHRGTKTLEIIDLKTGQHLKAIDVGSAQGVAIDAKAHKYFLGNEGEHSIAVVDSQTLLKTTEVKLNGPIDAIAFDEKNKMLYAAEDDGTHVWVVDTTKNKLAGTVTIPGVPEVLEFDSSTNYLYLNIKDKNTVVRIDPKTNKVNATWPSAPATSPHGLAIDSKRGWVYVAGGNGQLVALDIKTGKMISSAEISPGVDQIAFDVEKQTIYGACKGFISVTKVTDAGLTAMTPVPSSKGAHTLAVDPTSHDVWVSFADDTHSYLQKFKAAQ